MRKKKVYLVFREVIATSVEEATKKKGLIYSVQEANAETQLQLIKPKQLGFKK